MDPSRISPRRRSRRHGFTLLEAIIAIVMFTFIMLAVSQALQITLQSTSRSRRRQEDDGTVRAVFDSITADILSANGSMNSPSSVFITGGSHGASAPGDLLAFSAFSTRLQAPELDTQSGQSQGASQPQSDVGFVRYNFDSATGTLYRIVSPVPSQQNQAPAPVGPERAVAQNIVSVQFSFWDSTQQTWRSDWDYEQQNQIGVVPVGSDTTGASGSSGGSTAANSGGGSGAAAAQPTGNTTATGDTALPSAVRVTVTMQQTNGPSKDYVTTIPIGASQTFLDPNKTANVNTYPPTTAGASTATSGP